MKKYIIDGYNLLKSSAFNVPLNLSLEDQRNHLIRMIKSFSQSEQSEVLIIFDNSLSFSTNRNIGSGRIRIKFTKASMEADDLIKKIIRNEKNPKRLIIVSSDRAIQYTAKDHGAAILSSEDYYRIIEKRESSTGDTNKSDFNQEKYDPNLGKKEIQYWKELFKNDNKKKLK
jgi:predicted RNA-binding protein with PIN domain